MNSAQLNAMFNKKSNAAFNNALFTPSIIADMHQQMERLYKAARVLKKISGQSALANALNESPQTVNNWESRGISQQGLRKAEQVIGCSALWLETGAEPMERIYAKNEKQVRLLKLVQQMKEGEQAKAVKIIDTLSKPSEDDEKAG